MNTHRRSHGLLPVLRMMLLVAVILGALGQGVCLAQASPLAQGTQALARQFIDFGYSVVGPAGVVKMTDDAVTLRNPFKDSTLPLRGQNLTFMGTDARPVSRNSVVPGSNVYVCRKADQTTLIVLPNSR